MIITREFLSPNATGRGIKVVAVATVGTTIHTSHATAKEEIYLWVTNTHTSPIALTLEFGGATDPDDLLCKTMVIAANSPPIPIATGQVLSGGGLVTAFADTANKLSIHGYVNRITG